ncbi:hypothetical protein [Leucobacter aridicollis]|uniref:Uncharacterized protein n=1 Tax=Leucobacter aridicollis TaxID=283878 RepID=A0A852RC18_9MICO|nr:hypothetical protein [Leucobacter aridicollis]NYD26916.1 hypothetical protein [Leucobacter aridicollis]
MIFNSWKWIDLSAIPGPLDWAGFVLGGLGIGFTIYQLMKSKGALNAAREELERTRATLIKNQLLSVLPGFEELMDRIDDAVRTGNREELSTQFQKFAYRLAEAIPLLESGSTSFSSLIESMKSEITKALEARSSLYGSPDTPVDELVRVNVDSLQILVTQIKTTTVSVRNDPGKIPAEEAKNA